MATCDEQARWVSSTAAVFLTHDTLVQVSGDDGTPWLNGQVTNDVRTLRREAATYALAITVKGRVISDLWARAGEAGPVLCIPAATREALLTHLGKHIIMEDVELDPSAELRVVSVQGPRARDVVAGLTPPRDVYACGRLHAAGVDVVVPGVRLAETLADLNVRAVGLGGGSLTDAGLSRAHVLLGVPRVGLDFGEATYPQEAGLKGRAVSFSKGCYTGQEVVYMLENRGQLSRRLVQLTGPAAAPLARGASLYDLQGARVGEVTSAVVTSSPPDTTVALAYVKRPVAEVGATLTAGPGTPAHYTVRFVIGVTNDTCPIVAP